MNERIIELINGELDGANTSAESAELAKILEADESAMARFKENQVFFATLQSVTEAESPTGLKERIMESIAAEPATFDSTSTSFIDSLKTLFAPLYQKPAWALTYAFAAGLIVGIAALLIVGQPANLPPETVQGTMGQAPATIVDEARIEIGDVTVDLVTSHVDEESVLDVRISGSGEAIITVWSTAQEETTISASGPSHFTVALESDEQVEILVSSSDQQASTTLAAPGVNPSGAEHD